jgi:hypothetical protein
MLDKLEPADGRCYSELDLLTSTYGFTSPRCGIPWGRICVFAFEGFRRGS